MQCVACLYLGESTFDIQIVAQATSTLRHSAELLVPSFYVAMATSAPNHLNSPHTVINRNDKKRFITCQSHNSKKYEINQKCSTHGSDKRQMHLCYFQQMGKFGSAEHIRQKKKKKTPS